MSGSLNYEDFMMITLKTLSQATEQEVFDQVAKHMLTQNKKSKDIRRELSYDGCLYRSPDGLKCAAGCLIADDEYDPKFENKHWGALTASFPDVIPLKHEELISDLQEIHDTVDVYYWKDYLIELTNKFNLNWNFGE